MTDSVLRGEVSLVGIDQAISQVRAYASELRAVGALRPRVVVDLDTERARQQVAELRAQTQAFNAVTARMRVEAQIEPAQVQIRQLEAQTRNLTAQARIMKIEADVSPAMVALRQYEAETRRVMASAQQQQRAAAQDGHGFFGGLGQSVTMGGAFGVGAAIGSAGIGAVTQGLQSATKAGIDFNSELQQANVTFTTFLGSSQAAQAHLEELRRFSLETPFRFEELVQASERLQAMGFRAQEVVPALRSIGDAVSALGGGQDLINRITLALGQMGTRGRVSGEEIRQLSEAGVPAMQYLADAIGRTTAETQKLVEAGDINASTGIRAILGGLAADPRFAGMMEQQSRTFAGAMSNIQDAAQQAVAQGLRPLFDELNKDALALSNYTQTEDFAKHAQDFALGLHDDIEGVKALKQEFSDLTDPFLPLLETVVKYGNGLTAVNALFESLTGNKAARAAVERDTKDFTDSQLVAYRDSLQKQLDEASRQTPNIAQKALGVFAPLSNLFPGLTNNRRDLSGLREMIAEVNRIFDERNKAAYAASQPLGPKLPAGYRDDAQDLSALSAATKEYERAQKSALDAATQRAQEYASDLKQATQQASQAVASVDLSRGFRSIADAAPGLDRARDTLRSLGQESTALNRLTAMADEWHAITEAEDRATAAYRGYLQLTSETDKRIQQLQSLKQQYDEAADAARKAQASGQALTPAQQNILRTQPAVDANVEALIARLRAGGEAGDLTAAVKLAPDFAGADDQMRQWVQAHGGPQALQVGVKADTYQAQQDIVAFLEVPRQMVIKATLDMSNIPAAFRGFINRAFGGDAGAAAPGRSDIPGVNYGQGGPGAGGASTATPRGDAANLLPYADLIHKAAQMYGVPDWLIGAIIMHESGGTPGAIQQGGYGRGLTQVDIGQNPQYDARRLSGTGQDDIAYQINSGADILSKFLGQYGGNLFKAVQNYAGPAYRSVASGGVPGGLSFLDELTRYYQGPVQNALGGGGGATQVEHVADLAGGVTQQVQGVGPSSVLATARQHLNQKFDDAGRAVYGWCEEIVDDILAQTPGVTDFRAKYGGDPNGPASTADAHIRAAQQGLPGAGRVIDASQAQAGDIVGWLGTSQYAGDPRGHIGIVSGPGKYIGTTTQGVQERTIGPDAIFIRPDGVVANGPEPGSTLYDAGAAHGGGTAGSRAAAFDQRAAPGGNNRAPDSRFGVSPAGTIDLADPTTDAARASVAKQRAEYHELQDTILGTKAAARDFAASLAGIDPRDVQAVQQAFMTLLPLMEKAERAKLPDNADAVQQQTALNAAYARTLDASTAWARVMADIRNHSAGTAADIEKMAATVGGPLGQNLAVQATVLADMAARTDEINRLTQRRQDLQDQHTAQMAKDAHDDLVKRGQDLMRQISEQNADYTRQQSRVGEDTRDRTETRRIQDEGSAADRAHQLAQRDSAQQIRALEKLRETNASGNTAAEESFAARAAGPGDAASKRLAAESLAIQKEYDSRVKDTFRTQLDNIKEAQIAEENRYEDTKYNIQEEGKKETRRHEDVMVGFDAEDARIMRQRQLRQQSDEIAAYNQEVIRAGENQRFDAAVAGIDRTIASDQKLNEADSQRLTTAQQALSLWQQADGAGVKAADDILTAWTSGAARVQSILNAQPISPGSGAIRRLGGMASGGFIPVGASALTGDLPGGIPTSVSEVVTVTPQGAIVTPAGARGGANSGGAGVSIGNLIGNLSVAPGDSEATFKRRVMAAMDGPLSDIWRQLRTASRPATGAGRTVG